MPARHMLPRVRRGRHRLTMPARLARLFGALAVALLIAGAA